MPIVDDFEQENFRPVPTVSPPVAAWIAAVIWCVMGLPILLASLSMLIPLLMSIMTTDPERGGVRGWMLGAAVGLGFLAFAGLVFIITGIQTLRGRSRNTTENGVGAFVLGLLITLIGFYALWLHPERPQVEVAIILVGGLLGLSGILALAGTRSYNRWRRRSSFGKNQQQVAGLNLSSRSDV